MNKANEPAFPGQVERVGVDSFRVISEGGLTKREYFAAMVLTGLCTPAIPGPHNMDTESNNAENAKHAVHLADALIKALEEK